MPDPSDLLRTYEDAIGFLEESLDYEKRKTWSYNVRTLNLDRTRKLLAALGDPQQRFRIIHVAGTKGKGTTAGAAAHVLSRGGHTTGLLTSPHLITHRERIQIDGRMISKREFLESVRALEAYVLEKRREEREQHLRSPTYFELLTGLAFHHFARREVEWAVVEVGLGGRLDSTNVVNPDCCIITSIGYDHTDKLGDTIEAIAGEKAGILKAGVPVVLGRQRYQGALRTLRAVADERHCPRWEVGRELTITQAEALSAPADRPDAPVGWRFSMKTPGADYDDLHTPLLGRHQLDNLVAAVGALELTARSTALETDPALTADALADYTVPGRMEILQRSPAVILDVAHTVESVEGLTEALEAHFPGRPVHVVFGCSLHKNVRGMLEQLRGRCASFVATQARSARALPAQDVLDEARRVGLEPEGGLELEPDSWDAARRAFAAAGPADVVCITGSFFTTGEVRERWLEEGLTAGS